MKQHLRCGIEWGREGTSLRFLERWLLMSWVIRKIDERSLIYGSDRKH